MNTDNSIRDFIINRIHETDIFQFSAIDYTPFNDVNLVKKPGSLSSIRLLS